MELFPKAHLSHLKNFTLDSQNYGQITEAVGVKVLDEAFDD